METKSLIALIFLLQTITSCVNIVAQKPTTANEQFASCSKGNFQSDFKELDKAFKVLINFIGLPPYNGYATGNGEKVSTASLCSLNIRKEVCQECVNNTIPYLKKKCPNHKEGVAWTLLNNVPSKAHCMVRYADNSFGSQLLATWAWTTFDSRDKEGPTNIVDLEKGYNDLVNKLKSIYAGDPNKIGSGSVTYGPGSHKLYGFMQCTPSTSRETCTKCFSDATNNILNCCVRKRKWGGRALHSNCYIRYSHNNFITNP